MTDARRFPPAFEQGFVRILTKGGKTAGAGFLITDRYICTCAHVVAVASEGVRTKKARPTEPVEIEFPHIPLKPKCLAKVFKWRHLPSSHLTSQCKDHDIAILKIDQKEVPDEARPLEISLTIDVDGHPFSSYGYPPQKQVGVPAKGRLAGPPNDAGLLGIEADRCVGFFAEQGFSGAPVWDEEIGSVVGMIAWGEPERQEGIGFYTPLATVGIS